ncbi:hypothetical protein ACLOJK_028286, partial [Asimina triloba]
MGMGWAWKWKEGGFYCSKMGGSRAEGFRDGGCSNAETRCGVRRNMLLPSVQL